MKKDLSFINKHRVRRGAYGSDESYGCNGAFGFHIPGEARLVCCIASDQEGWEHVSVSFGNQSTKTPSWGVMCAIKDIFWELEEVVFQLHPAKSDYVNNHPGVLHLWRCTDGRKMPLPPAIMVGIKELNVA